MGIIKGPAISPVPAVLNPLRISNNAEILHISNNTEIAYTIYFGIEEPVTMEFTMEEIESVEGGFNHHIEQHFKQFGFSDIVAIERVIKQINRDR